MKRALSLVLIAAMMLSCVPAMAAEINTNTSQSGNTVVQYGVAENYIVTVPDAARIDAEGLGNINVSISNAMLASNATLKVYVTGDSYTNGYWHLTSRDNDANKLQYTISKNSVALGTNGEVLSVAAGQAWNSTVTATLQLQLETEVSQAGTYSDTLTFVVDYHKEANLPEKNEYGFYYGQPYVSTVDVDGLPTEFSLVLYPNGQGALWMADCYAWLFEYTIADGVITCRVIAGANSNASLTLTLNSETDAFEEANIGTFTWKPTLLSTDFEPGVWIADTNHLTNQNAFALLTADGVMTLHYDGVAVMSQNINELTMQNGIIYYGEYPAGLYYPDASKVAFLDNQNNLIFVHTDSSTQLNEKYKMFTNVLYVSEDKQLGVVLKEDETVEFYQYLDMDSDDVFIQIGNELNCDISNFYCTGVDDASDCVFQNNKYTTININSVKYSPSNHPVHDLYENDPYTFSGEIGGTLANGDAWSETWDVTWSANQDTFNVTLNIKEVYSDVVNNVDDVWQLQNGVIYKTNNLTTPPTTTTQTFDYAFGKHIVINADFKLFGSVDGEFLLFNEGIVWKRNASTTHQHVDDDADTYCDTCGEQMISQYTAFTVTAENRNMVGYTDQTTALTIPATFKNNDTWYKVTAIADNAFASTNLQQVQIPATIESIGATSFAQCVNLTAVNIAANSQLKTIKRGAFAFDTELKSINLGQCAQLESIEDMCFFGNLALKTVTLPSQARIDGNIFLGAEVTSISVTGTNNMTKLVDGVLYSDNMMTACYYVAGTPNEHVTLLDTTTRIAMAAFSNASFNTITLPAGLTTIESEAFSDCKNLTSIHVPGSVTTIEQWTFSGCTSLKEVTLAEGITKIQHTAFSNIAAESVGAIGSGADVQLPVSIVEIAGAAFYALPNLHTVDLSQLTNLTTLGKGTQSGAFEDNPKLAIIKLPSSLTYLDGAFVNGEDNIAGAVYIDDLDAFCALTNNHGNSTALLNNRALYLNGNLVTNLHISDNITYVANKFYGCTSITSITFDTTEGWAYHTRENGVDQTVSLDSSTLTNADAILDLFLNSDYLTWQYLTRS